METKANYVIVGIFTVVAIVAAFVFVYWTAAIGDRGETAVLRVRIPGSAAGLGRGSAVLFNGVKVGDVEPRLHRRQRPFDRHRRHRDRPADAAHQVDQGRYRHRRPHRPGQHRAEGRQPRRSPSCSTRPRQPAGSPKSPPTRRPSPICWKPRRTSSRAPTRCCPTWKASSPTSARRSPTPSTTPRNSRRRWATTPTASMISWPA